MSQPVPPPPIDLTEPNAASSRRLYPGDGDAPAAGPSTSSPTVSRNRRNRSADSGDVSNSKSLSPGVAAASSPRIGRKSADQPLPGSPTTSRDAFGDGGDKLSPTRSLLDLGRTVSGHFAGADNVPIVEALQLSPFEKFRRYRILPWKLIVHTLIFGVLLTLTFGVHLARNRFNINARFGLALALGLAPADNTGPSLTHDFFELDQAVKYIQGVGRAYYQLPSQSPGVFMHYVKENVSSRGEDFHDGRIAPPVLKMKLLKSPYYATGEAFGDGATETMETELAPDNDFLGGTLRNAVDGLPSAAAVGCPVMKGAVACRNSTLPILFDRLVEGQLTFHLRSIRHYTAASPASVCLWTATIGITFDSNDSRLRFAATLDPRYVEAPSTLEIVCSSLLVPLVLLHLLLRLRAFHWYRLRMRELLPLWAMGDAPQQQQHLGISWRVYAIALDVTCLLFLGGTMVDIFIRLNVPHLDTYRKLMLGFSVAGYNVLYVSYLQASPRFYVLVKSLSIAIPALVRYCVGAVPIFVAYLLCFVAITGPWAQDTFGTVQLCACTLFCVLNGDSLLQLFTQINQSDFWPLRVVTPLLFASFLAYFITTSLNVMLAIVQEAYVEVREVFEVCQYDLDKANRELELEGLPAGERRRKKRQRRRKQIQQRREEKAQERRFQRALEQRSAADEDDMQRNRSRSSNSLGATLSSKRHLTPSDGTPQINGVPQVDSEGGSDDSSCSSTSCSRCSSGSSSDADAPEIPAVSADLLVRIARRVEHVQLLYRPEPAGGGSQQQQPAPTSPLIPTPGPSGPF